MAPATFQELSAHLLQDEAPSRYIAAIAGEPFFREHPFIMLARLKETEQSPVHHPEGSVWNHSLLVLDNAAKLRDESRDPLKFMWAALLHDIGKPDTTRLRRGRITSYDHDKAGAALTVKFFQELTDDGEFIESVAALVRWHMQILFVINNLPFADINAMKRHTDVREVALLGMCDRLGRLNADYGKEKANMELFLKKIKL